MAIRIAQLAGQGAWAEPVGYLHQWAELAVQLFSLELLVEVHQVIDYEPNAPFVAIAGLGIGPGMLAPIGFAVVEQFNPHAFAGRMEATDQHISADQPIHPILFRAMVVPLAGQGHAKEIAVELKAPLRVRDADGGVIEAKA